DSISRLSRASFSSVLRCSARSASNSWSRALSVSRLAGGVSACGGARCACADAATTPSDKTPANPSSSERRTTGERKATCMNSLYAKNGSTEIHSYDWHRIKTRGKVFAIGGRATARFSVFLRRNGRSRAMIGMPGQDGNGAIKLLHEHDSNELMRPCRRPEGNGKARLFTQARREPVGSADDEYDRR